MKWRVAGADAETGQETAVVVEAEDPITAQEQARANGIFSATVEAVPPKNELPYRSRDEDARPSWIKRIGKALWLPFPSKPILTPQEQEWQVRHEDLENAMVSDGMNFNHVGGFIVIICCIFGLIASSSGDFKSDNAIGAMANRLGSLEFLAGILIGLLFVINGNLVANRAHQRVVEARRRLENLLKERRAQDDPTQSDAG
jgi:hypothetical protein